MSRSSSPTPRTDQGPVTQFLFKQLSLTLVFWLLAPVASLTQESGPRADAGTPADSAPFSTARVIDVEAARRAKEREHSTKPLDLPLLPSRYLGCQIEKGLIAVDRHHLMDRAQYYMTERDHGFVPLFGDLGVGTGLTLGVKYYRNDFLRPGGHVEFPVRVSTKLYQEYGAALKMPVDSRQRVFIDSGAYYRVRTQDNFFGSGNDSRATDRTTYMLHSREIFIGPRLELKHGFELAGRLGYRDTSVFDGRDARFPAITERFSTARIPALADGAREWIAGVELAYDDRDVPGRPRRGGYHRFAAAWHQSAGTGNFGFWRYEVNAERYIPLGSRYRVLALRFEGISNQPRGGSAVPFFEQATLGGRNTLRGFAEDRFHDLSGMLMSLEYRYNLNSFMDVITFVDAGQVARSFGDFSWNAMHVSYGGGLRFLSAKSTPFKIIVARSNEDTRVYFTFGARF